MIHLVTPKVRQQLVKIRIIAMSRGGDVALREIINRRHNCNKTADLIVLGLIESEIYALDFRGEEALEAFNVHVEPFLEKLDPSSAAIIADNKTLGWLHTQGWHGVEEFYHVLDIRRILGVELRDHSAVLEARRAAAKGKHYDALPTYWQQLRKGYQLQNWRARLISQRDFAQECIDLCSFD